MPIIVYAIQTPSQRSQACNIKKTMELLKMTKLSLDKTESKFMFWEECCIVYTCFESLNNTIKRMKADTEYKAASIAYKTKE